MIWQRLRNIWRLSAVSNPGIQAAITEKYIENRKRDITIHPTGKAEIIKRKPIDPIDEIVNS